VTAHELDDSPPISGTLQRVVDATRKLGEQTAFYGQALWSTPYAVRRYPEMVLRQIAGMGMGSGALAVIGGTVAIIGFLTLCTGALIAAQGYNTLSNVGIEPSPASWGRSSTSVSSHRRPREWRWPPPSAPVPPRRSAPCASTRRSTRWR
jgi:hypothetical protein